MATHTKTHEVKNGIIVQQQPLTAITDIKNVCNNIVYTYIHIYVHLYIYMYIYRNVLSHFLILQITEGPC